MRKLPRVEALHKPSKLVVTKLKGHIAKQLAEMGVTGISIGGLKIKAAEIPSLKSIRVKKHGGGFLRLGLGDRFKHWWVEASGKEYPDNDILTVASLHKPSLGGLGYRVCTVSTKKGQGGTFFSSNGREFEIVEKASKKAGN
jgi:hypothetical protein